MRILVSALVSGIALATPAAATEPFHTASFPDHTIVSLSLVGNQTAASIEYDYDVYISLSTVSTDGYGSYSDPSRHKASVRCHAPEAVAVRGVSYAIPTPAEGGTDWKDDLWRAVCTIPVS
ncbi:hypothetical protein [Sinorhizobium sp. GL28]|jgi:hypothetical protein|uniref:hypothetical protein n=1 Tax=Sinorhizobium sp. GL28 TaxID=1358418 RepID=UPI00071CEB30|nr:hypothetical protein [Sinorhizobium sp. GL28]KSV91835.1 hypothetical protein N184_37710 [Sinorhizobium sp. GL28]